jgi:hypothetical protein
VSKRLHAAVVELVERLRDLADSTDEGDALVAATTDAVEKLANAIVAEAVEIADAQHSGL